MEQQPTELHQAGMPVKQIPSQLGLGNLRPTNENDRLAPLVTYPRDLNGTSRSGRTMDSLIKKYQSEE